jgi:hypothetical protein
MPIISTNQNLLPPDMIYNLDYVTTLSGVYILMRRITGIQWTMHRRDVMWSSWALISGAIPTLNWATKPTIPRIRRVSHSLERHVQVSPVLLWIQPWICEYISGMLIGRILSPVFIRRTMWHAISCNEKLINTEIRSHGKILISMWYWADKITYYSVWSHVTILHVIDSKLRNGGRNEEVNTNTQRSSIYCVFKKNRTTDNVQKTH